jgi:hypothetical protein
MQKTFEHLLDALDESPDKVMVCIMDEFVRLLSGLGAHKSNSGGKDQDTSTVLTLKEGGSMEGSTITRGEKVVPYTHVVFSGGMQPGMMHQNACENDRCCTNADPLLQCNFNCQ